MTSLKQDIIFKLKRLNVFEKIIVVNLILYVIGWILQLILGTNGNNSLHWFELPKQFSEFIMKPWSIVTYGFIHYGFLHILFNLIALHYIAQLMLNLFNPKMALNIFFLGIIIGGFSFLLMYNVFPSIMLKQVGALVGASAGIRALLIFLCVYLPQKEIRLLSFNIKLWYIGIVLVIIDVIGLFSLNQGGNVAHLGGSLLGYLYAVQLQKGTDIGKGFERFLDYITSLFKTKSPLKTVHRGKKKPFAGHNKNEFNEFSKQKRIDLILDKISKSGYESLTKEEKEFLFKAGKE
jgi:membrane associated rhomboid family serine protease